MKGWNGSLTVDGDLVTIERGLRGSLLTRGGKRWCLGSLRGDLLRKVNGRAFVVDLLRGVAAGWNGH